MFIALQPAVFGVPATGAVTAYLDELRASEPAPRQGAVTVPGDRARAVRIRHLEHSVPVPATMWGAHQIANGVGHREPSSEGAPL